MCTDIVSAMHPFYCISKFITAIVIKLQVGGICDNASNEAFFKSWQLPFTNKVTNLSPQSFQCVKYAYIWLFN